MRRAIACLACFAVAAVPVGLTAVAALADGDPASDELVGANVFYPFSPPVSAGLQRTLNSETVGASRVHFPIKVALIASPADLGAAASLFAKPQQYADFLDAEISFGGTQALLLVVMPDGYGVRGLPRLATLTAASLAKPSGRQSDDLARAAILAVPKLAAAAGDPIKSLPVAPAADGGSGGGAAGGGAAFVAGVAMIGAAAVVWFRRRRAQIP